MFATVCSKKLPAAFEYSDGPMSTSLAWPIMAATWRGGNRLGSRSMAFSTIAMTRSVSPSS
jgi:hypothetical protein